MAKNRDIDEEDEWEEEDTPPKRRSGPRFGPILTITIAILVLFGTASRLGKPEGATGLSALDLSAKTVISLGSKPVLPEPLAQPVLPPSRGEFDLDAYQRQKQLEQYQRQYQEEMQRQTASQSMGQSGLSMAIGDPREEREGYEAGRFDPAPEAVAEAETQGSTYTVRAGDNWVKIGKATGKNWQVIQRANPSSQKGLTVGMRLVIPKG